MSKRAHSTTSKNIKLYQATSLTAYVLVAIIASGVLLIEPNNFDAKTMIVPLIAFLVLSSVGVGYGIAAKSEGKIVSSLGIIALTILFTFIGCFIVAGVAWFIGLGHAS